MPSAVSGARPLQLNFGCHRPKARVFSKHGAVAVISTDTSLTILLPNGETATVAIREGVHKHELQFKCGATSTVLHVGSLRDTLSVFKSMSKDLFPPNNGIRKLEIGVLGLVSGFLMGAALSWAPHANPDAELRSPPTLSAPASPDVPKTSLLQSPGAMSRVRNPVDLDAPAVASSVPPSTSSEGTPAPASPATPPAPESQPQPASSAPTGKAAEIAAARAGYAKMMTSAPEAAAAKAQAFDEAASPVNPVGLNQAAPASTSTVPVPSTAATATDAPAPLPQSIAADPAAAEKLLATLRDLHAKADRGEQVTPEMISRLPSSIAASLNATGITKPRPQRAAHPNPASTPLPSDVFLAHRDKWGISDLPSGDSWAGGGKVMLPLPGGGDIRRTDDFGTFGLEK